MSGDDGLINTSALYKDNPVWADVTPIYPTADENAAVRIKYDPDFIDAFAYLRALLQTGEKSERALDLTIDCISKNAANYTLWQYRRDVLRALEKDLHAELRFLSDVILENPKNYQVWHHRRAIIEWLNDATGELSFTEEVLLDENKNYHAWQHRQWVVRRFDLPAAPELDFSMRLIMEDPRNNSAWNYRYFILQNNGGFADEKRVDFEINLSLQLVTKIPHNESVWNYMLGILSDAGINSRPALLSTIKEQYDSTEKANRSFHMVSFLVDALQERITKGENVLENAEEAKKYLDELIALDPVRTAYWTYQKLVAECALQKELQRPQLVMRERPLHEFSHEPSDYLIPPSHKTIILMDHGPKFARSANAPLTMRQKAGGDKAPRSIPPIDRSLWSMSAEAVLEVRRIVHDLFAGNERLLRIVLADIMAKHLSPAWEADVPSYDEICRQLGNAGAPTEADISSYSLLGGITMAVEALSEVTPLFTRLSALPSEELCDAARDVSRGYALLGNPSIGKMGEQCEPAFRILNKGSILVYTTISSEAELEELQNDVVDVINGRNRLAKSSADSMLAIDHVNLFIINVQPVGEEPTLKNRPLVLVNPVLSVYVRNCSGDGVQITVATHATILPLYDLASTTVANIPMKEDSNASNSIQYDVELIAHSELARSGFLDNDVDTLLSVDKSVIDLTDDAEEVPMETSAEEVSDWESVEKKKESERCSKAAAAAARTRKLQREGAVESKVAAAARACGLVAPTHSGAYATIRLTWATTSPKNTWISFPRTLSAVPVTPAWTNSRPSVCLTSFLAAGRTVMLEIKNAPLAVALTEAERSKKATETLEFEQENAPKEGKEDAFSKNRAAWAKANPAAKQYTEGIFPNYVGSDREKKVEDRGPRLIAHTLQSHNSRIYIHGMRLASTERPVDNPAARLSSGIKIPTGLRTADFASLMKEMMVAGPSLVPVSEGVEDGQKVEQPNKDALKRAARLTRYWPTRLAHSYIFNFSKKFEPLLTVIRQAELSTSDVDQCKQVFTSLLAHKESTDQLTYTKFTSKIIGDEPTKEEQLAVAFQELTAHLGNYVNHSERHAEVFKMWAQLSGIEFADHISLDDVRLSDEKSLLLPVHEYSTERITMPSGAENGKGAFSGRATCVTDAMRRQSVLQKKTKAAGETAPMPPPNRARIRMYRHPVRGQSHSASATPSHSRSSSPQPKKSRNAKYRWTVNETRSILDVLIERQNPTVVTPRADFVARDEARGSAVVKLYAHLGNVADLRPGKGMVEG